MPTELSDADYATLAEFRFSLRQFLAFSQNRAAECGLTPQQHQALLAIRAAPAVGATVGYVADRLILKPHSATGLVDRLVALQFTPAADRVRREGRSRPAAGERPRAPFLSILFIMIV